MTLKIKLLAAVHKIQCFFGLKYDIATAGSKALAIKLLLK